MRVPEGGDGSEEERDSKEAVKENSDSKEVTTMSDLLNLLHYHLDLFDQWQPKLGRPYETLKRFFKIYIRDFDGAKDLRDRLMHTKNTSEARDIIKKATS